MRTVDGSRTEAIIAFGLLVESWRVARPFAFFAKAGAVPLQSKTSLASRPKQNFNRSYTYNSLNHIQSMSAPGDGAGGPAFRVFLRRLGVFIRRNDGQVAHPSLFGLEWSIPLSAAWRESSNVRTNRNQLMPNHFLHISTNNKVCTLCSFEEHLWKNLGTDGIDPNSVRKRLQAIGAA